jgi:hypothetical protein
MLNPRRSNGVIETICTAVSYEVLDRMSDRWMIIVPFPYLRGYEMNGSSGEFVGESGKSVAVNPPAPGGGFAPATL